MRFSSITLLTAVSALTGCSAWTLQQRSLSSTRPSSSSSSSFTRLLVSVDPSASTSSTSASSSNSNANNIASELESGRILEGGKVMDFNGVKASSKAETALAAARTKVLKHGLSPTTQSDEILGINQDVVDEVGHPLATFCTAQEVQDCAAWIRSKAKPGFFKTAASAPNGDGGLSHYVEQLHHTSSSQQTTTTDFTPQQVERFESILAQAYDESGEVTSAFAKTFYLGTMLLGMEARKAIWAVYVWCRRTDEIVDAPREGENANDLMLQELSAWEMRLENLWSTGTVVDAFDLCLLDSRVQYPTLDITPFMDMIRGMLMDVPHLGQEQYINFDELHLYCYRVAGTVGLMSLPVFGCAPGVTDEQAREPALSLGVAFQLTNILRDVGEDAVQRGRIYLPEQDLERFGVTKEQIFEQRVDENYINMMKFQIKRARMYYERARRGVFMLAEDSRLPVQTSLDAYGKILDKIEDNGYDSLTKRAYVDKWEKLSIIPFSWYRTLDISRQLPLPGDAPVSIEV